MERQNITVSLPKDVLQKVKHLAIDKNTSISALLANTLEEIVRKDESYAKAKTRQLTTMKKGFEMGIRGKIPWKRDELHDR